MTQPSEQPTQWFIEQGIDPRDGSKRYENNDTPLHIASRKGNLDAVQWLLDNSTELALDVNAKNNDGNPPLWHACFAGSTEIVSLLHKHGADINLTNDNNTTSLMYCSSSGREELTKLLLELGADKAIENLDGYTALDHATTREILKLLR